MNMTRDANPPAKAKRRVNPRVLDCLPLLFPISLWILTAIKTGGNDSV